MLFGIRNTNGKPDQWCDLIGWYTATDFRAVVGTTRPGIATLRAPMNPNGTAILKPGLYRDVYQIGHHQGRTDHEAFVQVGRMAVWRDNDRDTQWDLIGHDVGLFGINLHRANRSNEAAVVGPHSAGCQVIRRASSLLSLLSAAKQANQRRFSYILVEAPL